MTDNKLERWKAKATLLNILKYYDIDYETSTLNSVNLLPEVLDDEIFKGIRLPPVENLAALSIDVRVAKNEDNIKNIIPKTVKNIDSGAFYRNKHIREIILPEGLERIGARAFAECTELERIVIPANVKEIAGGAFYGCKKLRDVEILCSEDAYIAGTAFDNTPWLKEYLKKNPLWVRGKTLIRALSTEVVVIPEGIEIISEGCFRNNRKLVSVSIPSSVTRLPHSCFRSCPKLTSIRMTKSIEYIGPCTFMNCKSLESFVIPPKVEVIYVKTFDGCENLEKLIVPDSLRIIEPVAICNTKVEEIKLPQKFEKLYLDSILSQIGHGCKVLIPKTARVYIGSIQDEDGLKNYLRYEMGYNLYDYYKEETNRDYMDGDYIIQTGDAVEISSTEHLDMIYKGLVEKSLVYPTIEYY